MLVITILLLRIQQFHHNCYIYIWCLYSCIAFNTCEPCKGGEGGGGGASNCHWNLNRYNTTKGGLLRSMQIKLDQILNAPSLAPDIFSPNIPPSSPLSSLAVPLLYIPYLFSHHPPSLIIRVLTLLHYHSHPPPLLLDQFRCFLLSSLIPLYFTLDPSQESQFIVHLSVSLTLFIPAPWSLQLCPSFLYPSLILSYPGSLLIFRPSLLNPSQPLSLCPLFRSSPWSLLFFHPSLFDPSNCAPLSFIPPKPFLPWSFLHNLASPWSLQLLSFLLIPPHSCFSLIALTLPTSFLADPLHFGTDPDPRIRASD